jgi:ubiquinone/menaquinone biosynthesis C-methylase UbiE
MEKDGFVCTDCYTKYPKMNVAVGDHEEVTYDFRITPPSYCVPEALSQWNESQKDYEQFDVEWAERDKLNLYLDEINSVYEIYTQEFNIQGSVLDVGGHQGRLRHFLNDQRNSPYVSVDPFLNVFENIQYRPNLIKAYPCLSKPCNFLVCRAEALPFISNAFDWVHMRYVVDHFENPFMAFKEAYRVLKPQGNLMIGLAIMEKTGKSTVLLKIKSKIEREGIASFLKAVQKRICDVINKKTKICGDHHLFRLSVEQLRDISSVTGFTVTKEHWQKPPYNCCIYLTARPKK